MFHCGNHATKPVSTKMASTIPTTLCPLLRLTLSQRASRGETVWMIVPGIIELEGKPEIGGCNDVDSHSQKIIVERKKTFIIATFGFRLLARTAKPVETCSC